MSPLSRAIRRDIRELVGMSSPAAKAIVAFYAATNLMLAVVSHAGVSAYWPIAVALMIVTLGGVALIRIPGDPLPLGTACALTAVGPVACALVTSVIPVPTTSPMQLWPVAAVTAIYAFMGVRGRTVFAWFGMLLTIATCVVWTASTGQGAAHGLEITVINLAPLLMATFFTFTVRPAATDIFTLRDETTGRVAVAAADTAVLDERDRQLRRLDEQARPLLERIAAGGTLDAAEEMACRLLEAQLRDAVRAPALTEQAVVAAARSARARGVEVTLLDDHAMDAAPAQARDLFMASVATTLERMDRGAVTVRILPPGRTAMATILCSGADGVLRTEFGHDGRVVTQPDFAGAATTTPVPLFLRAQNSRLVHSGDEPYGRQHENSHAESSSPTELPHSATPPGEGPT